ncbi:MAG: hypothetical protein J6X44_04360 [Thermoguttaceae bacterium]|nr:hypothetical protein [Thermoguttaceae bacterium]
MSLIARRTESIVFTGRSLSLPGNSRACAGVAKNANKATDAAKSKRRFIRRFLSVTLETGNKATRKSVSEPFAAVTRDYRSESSGAAGGAMYWNNSIGHPSKRSIPLGVSCVNCV